MSQNNQWGNDQWNNNNQWGDNNQYGQQPVQPPPNYSQPQYGQQPPFPQYGGYPVQQPKRGGCLKWILIGGLLLVVLCGFGAYYVVNWAQDSTKANLQTIDTFMKAGASNNPAGGVAVASKAWVANGAESEISKFFVDRSDVFDGYQSVDSSITSGNSMSLKNQNGIETMEMTGSIKYSSEPTSGTFRAHLTKESGSWKIDTISINR